MPTLQPARWREVYKAARLMCFVRFQIQVIATNNTGILCAILLTFSYTNIVKTLFSQQVMKHFTEHKGSMNWNHAIKQ